MLARIINYLKKHSTAIILLTLLVVAGISHGYNMLHFPYFENDEGTYMSQAWALLKEGKLAPYTYWYDHSPLGWFLIAAWAALTGGFSTFGLAVDSGRVFMLVLHIVSSALLFYIAKKITKRNFAGIVAVLIFSLSPLGIYFQRRVLLDNIMTFWTLLSLAILYKDNLKLSHILLSSVTFAIATLTKENAIFLFPVFLYLVIARSHKFHKVFATVEWMVVYGSLVSAYALYALLKGEFFPIGFLGGNTEHVSLITTLSNQLSRGTHLPLLDKQSEFYISLVSWLGKDKILVFLGLGSIIASSLLSIKVKILRVPALLCIFLLLFILRGKLVIDFYIIPLIPIVGLNIGILTDFLLTKLTFKKTAILLAAQIFVISSLSVYFLRSSIGQYALDETTPQREALNWVFENVPNTAVIAIDDFAEVEFREHGYTNAAWFWKFWSDPEIKQKYNYDWKNIDYLFLSHEMLKQMGYKHDRNDVLRNVYQNSNKVVIFGPSETGTYVNFDKFITTNGDWAAVYKLRPQNQLVLSTAWEAYKENYIVSYGQVIDKSDNDKTTSEGQSYAMLRAVWQNDKETFDSTWSWARDHMQFRIQDNLFSWLWVKDGNGGYEQGDSATAADADEDIALALAFAYKTWGDKAYLDEAKKIIVDIWAQDVVEMGDHYYMTSGSDAWRYNKYLVNVSYVSPATYRIFAEVDPTHNWNRLADDSYYLLNKLKGANSLPPNWIIVDAITEEVRSASEYVTDPNYNNYGFDAFRTMWRVALDAKWFDSDKAENYLKSFDGFYTKEWERGDFYAIYTTSGKHVSDYSSLSTSTAALAVFTVTSPEKADEVYNNLFATKFNFDDGSWGNKNNYYDQNWAWFGTALYTDNARNLWN